MMGYASRFDLLLRRFHKARNSYEGLRVESSTPFDHLPRYTLPSSFSYDNLDAVDAIHQYKKAQLRRLHPRIPNSCFKRDPAVLFSTFEVCEIEKSFRIRGGGFIVEAAV